MQAIIFTLLKCYASNFALQSTVAFLAAVFMPYLNGRKITSVSLLPLPSHHVQTAQSVYGLAEEGTQSQSPIHTPLHHCRKGTKEDVEKEVKNLSQFRK